MSRFAKLFSIPREIAAVVASRQSTMFGTVVAFALFYFFLGSLGLLAEPAANYFEYPYLDALVLTFMVILVPIAGRLISNLTSNRALVTLAIWIAVGAVSLFASEQLLSLLVGQPVPQYRVSNFMIDATAMVVNLASYSIIIAAVRRYRLARKSLSRELGRLTALRSGLGEQLQQLRDRYASEVRSSLAPTLEDLALALKNSDANQLAAQARSAIEEVVLPLNQNISTDSTADSLPEITRRVKLRDISSYRFAIGDLFSPLLTAILFFATLLSAFMYFYPDGGIAAGTLCGLSVALLLVAVKILVGSIKLNTWWSLTLVALISIGFGFASVWIGAAMLPKVDDAVQSFLAFGVILVIYFIGLFQLAVGIGAKNLASLSEASSEYSRLLQRKNSEIRHFKNQLSQAIHGDIQGKLRALLLRVKNGGLENNSFALLADLDHIKSTLAQINQEQHFDFKTEISELKEFWSGVCELQVDIEHSAEAALLHDEQTARSSYAVISEAVANAVKHAEAKTASVALRLDGDQIELLVTNSQKYLTDATMSTGAGSKLFDELCTGWSLKVDDQQTKFVGHIGPVLVD